MVRGFWAPGSDRTLVAHIEDLSRSRALFSWSVSGFAARYYDQVDFQASYAFGTGELTILARPLSTRTADGQEQAAASCRLSEP